MGSVPKFPTKFPRDPHLRNLKHFHGIKIIDVKEFLQQVEKRKKKK